VLNFFHTHTHPESLATILCQIISVWSQTVCLCKESRSVLKEKETVSDEFCWHLSNKD